MKKYIFVFISVLQINYICSQTNFETYFFDEGIETINTSANLLKSPSQTTSITTWKTSNGYDCSPRGTYRALAIFVNIIYDQTSQDTVMKYTDQSTFWQPDIDNSINMYPPSYFQNLFDLELDPNYNYSGVVTRLYAESSFNQLLMLSDIMVVNIKQSLITPNNHLNGFDYYQLMNAVITFINNRGGLNAVFGHNEIDEYDRTSFLSNTSSTPDQKIDFVYFLTRNTFKKEFKDNNGNLILKHDYGSINKGQGYGGPVPTNKLLVGDSLLYGFNKGNYQCVGGGDMSVGSRTILGHEIAHFFLGSNNFHTSGGNHLGTSDINTFIGIQYGYGLFDGGLSSCNGYERWRLGWYSPYNNLEPIASNNQNSDILTKFTGEKTFLLRDFVTYGDVIRIKLPYKDSELSSNQYIWLENHQCGKNNKLDDQNYSSSGSCRDVTKAGIYSYYQVGKDRLESTVYKSDLFPPNETDNLRIISAEGNYDMKFLGWTDDCLGWGGVNGRSEYEYKNSNPLQGSNDQTEVFPATPDTLSLKYRKSWIQTLCSKMKNKQPQENLPWLGDNYDAFSPTVDGIVMDISSNPTPINTTTYYCYRYISNNLLTFNPVTPERNTRKLYLTGLSIKMIDPDSLNSGIKAYTVKIRWDDYDVKQNVSWTGDIVLKEQLNLLQGKTITLQQSYTVNQIPKDPVSNFFAKTTFFTCEGNSVFNMAVNSQLQLKDKSSFIMNANSTMNVLDGAVITIESGSTLQIKSGANINIYGSGKIVVKAGGYICVESGANINLQDYTSLIVLEEGAIYGANPALFSSNSCSSSITKTGNGSIADFNQDFYIQDETISTNRYFGYRNIYVGNHVTTAKSFGDVSINNGANVIFDCKEIVFDAGFECATGSTYEVKNH